MGSSVCTKRTLARPCFGVLSSSQRQGLVAWKHSNLASLLKMLELGHCLTSMVSKRSLECSGRKAKEPTTLALRSSPLDLDQIANFQQPSAELSLMVRSETAIIKAGLFKKKRKGWPTRFSRIPRGNIALNGSPAGLQGF